MRNLDIIKRLRYKKCGHWISSLVQTFLIEIKVEHVFYSIKYKVFAVSPNVDIDTWKHSPNMLC